MQLMVDLPPADWYSDPEDPDQFRYWDGSQWTEHRAPRYSGASVAGSRCRHRSVGDLLANTCRMATQNWRPLLVIYAVVAVVFLAGEEAVTRGYDDVFGDTLGTLVNELEALETGNDSEEAVTVLEARWSDLTDRIGGLGSLTLAAGVLLMVVGGVAVVAINIVEFAAFGQFTMARLDGRPMGAARALAAGLGRLLRIIGVGLMLLVMWCAAIMAVSIVAGLLVVASGVLGAGLIVAVLVMALLVLVVGGLPVALLAVVTAAAGPATPSMRYARGLLRGTYWATLGRVVLLLVLSMAATIPVVVAGEAAGFFSDRLAGVVLVVLSVFPEVLFSIALFTVYRDLGGESADPAVSPAA